MAEVVLDCRSRLSCLDTLPSPIAWRPILCGRHQLEVASFGPACTIVMLLWWSLTIDFLAIASLQEALRETVAVMLTCFDTVD